MQNLFFSKNTNKVIFGYFWNVKEGILVRP